MHWLGTSKGKILLVCSLVSLKRKVTKKEELKVEFPFGKEVQTVGLSLLCCGPSGIAPQILKLVITVSLDV